MNPVDTRPFSLYVEHFLLAVGIANADMHQICSNGHSFLFSFLVLLTFPLSYFSNATISLNASFVIAECSLRTCWMLPSYLLNAPFLAVECSLRIFPWLHLGKRVDCGTLDEVQGTRTGMPGEVSCLGHRRPTPPPARNRSPPFTHFAHQHFPYLAGLLTVFSVFSIAGHHPRLSP